MEWRKLKNIIILILLLLNGFLLVLVGSRYVDSLQYERAALERTLKVLADHGIETDPDRLFPAGALSPLTVERDLERELNMAQALLGSLDVEADNRGGELYLYQSGSGELSVRAGGELTAEIADNPNSLADGGPGRHAAGLLKKMGINAQQIDVAEGDGGTRVRFRQSWNGVPVFSGEVEFVYDREARLSSVEGTLFTAGDGTEEAGECMALPTALMRFYEEISATGDVCSAILSMEPGYRAAAQSLSGGTRLSPVWLVTTDIAQYYLDCATGALTRLTDQ